MLKNIFFEFEIRNIEPNGQNLLEILHSKRDYYRLDTSCLMKILTSSCNPYMDYYSSLLNKKLVVVGGTRQSACKESFVIFKDKKIRGVIEREYSSYNDKTEVYLSVFIHSLLTSELAMILEIILPEQLERNINKARDKIIEKITGLPSPSLQRMLFNDTVLCFLEKNEIR